MGFLTDIRSGKRDGAGIGVYAVIFWFCVGLVTGGWLGAWVGASSEKGVLPFALIGAAIGLGVGFHAAFGVTRAARTLALPGALLAGIGFLVGM